MAALCIDPAQRDPAVFGHAAESLRAVLLSLAKNNNAAQFLINLTVLTMFSCFPISYVSAQMD